MKIGAFFHPPKRTGEADRPRQAGRRIETVRKTARSRLGNND